MKATKQKLSDQSKKPSWETKYIYHRHTRFLQSKRTTGHSFVSRNMNWTNKLIVLKTRVGRRIRHKKKSQPRAHNRKNWWIVCRLLVLGGWWEEAKKGSTSAFATASMMMLLQLQVRRRVSFHWFFIFFYFSSLFLYFCMHQANFL